MNVAAPALRMRDAAFTARGRRLLAPVTFDVPPREHVARVCASAAEAEILAMAAAALVRVTSGTVSIGPYDPRVQPVHCKRLAGYVPHDPLPLSDMMSFDRYVEYRAALWDIEPLDARARAAHLLERLEGMHEAFAYPLVGALLSEPMLLVLDRPQRVFAPQILAAAGERATLSTHVDELSAQTFAPHRKLAAG
jgi:ABC-type multidrug transport system ATPase subunit